MFDSPKMGERIMALENPNLSLSSTEQPLRYDDPIVIGAGALLLGYAIGSGRLGWLGQEAAKIAKNLGSIAMSCFSRSLQEHNPQLFDQKYRVTH